MVNMVTVACKHPNGLVLNLDMSVKVGDRGETQVIKGEKTVTLKGWARPWGTPDTTEGGYALTQVPADFWEAWYKLNSDSPFIVNKVILGPHKDQVGQSRDHAEVEQMFRPAREGDVKGIKADDKAA